MRGMLLTAGLLAAVGAVVAQPPGGEPGRFRILGHRDPAAALYGRLAASKVLADELKLTDAQKGQLNDTLALLLKAEREANGPKSQPKSPAEYREWEAKQLERHAEMKVAVEKVLTAEQSRRLTQIAYRQAGWSAFAFPEVRDGLKLTAMQREQLDEVLIEGTDRQSELLRQPPPAGVDGKRPGPDERQKWQAERKKKLDAGGNQTLERVLKLLDARQQAAWKEMLGKELDLAKLREEATPRPTRPAAKDK